jgi:hypothetical protein
LAIASTQKVGQFAFQKVGHLSPLLKILAMYGRCSDRIAMYAAVAGTVILVCFSLFVLFSHVNEFDALSREKGEHYTQLHPAHNLSLELAALQEALAAAQKYNAKLSDAFLNLHLEHAALKHDLAAAQNRSISLDETVRNITLELSAQKQALAVSPKSSVTLKPHMTRAEWMAFVQQQLRATNNFSAAMYARWSNYLKKEWINDDYKAFTPKAMEWDNCMNGKHYCVISLGLYAHEASYLGWIKTRLPLYREAMETFWPGWRLRLYYDESVPFSVLESVAAQGAETILSTDLKGHIAGMFWRFYVADDIEVDRYAIRDLDSDFTWRERSAIDDWIRSKVGFHAMADAENHNVPIMGGLWGGSSAVRLPFSIREQALQHQGKTAQKGGDQDFLKDVVWPAWQASGCVCVARCFVLSAGFLHMSNLTSISAGS